MAYVLAKLPAGERTVYNLEVHGDHTYYAGDQGVWVHNCGGVYTLRNAAGQVRYVGRTKDFASRAASHARNPKFKGLTMQEEVYTNSRNIQRRMEQKLFDDFGGKSGLLNKINPISPLNPNRSGYMRAANDYIRRSGGG